MRNQVYYVLVVVAPLAPQTRTPCLPSSPRKPLPVRAVSCTLAMFVPLRELRSSFEEKWNKFKYIFSAFRIKQKDASQRCCFSSQFPFPLLLLHLRPSARPGLLLLLGCSFAKPWASLFIFRPFAVLAFASLPLPLPVPLPAPFIVVVLATPAALPLPLSLFTYLLLRFIILH